ncbi:alpha/beta fold hydrolase [Leifsonia poae]|uniref:Alpha/beta hydrolase n=2 Tax=Leifsonia poae TaxID=110933 RepID=A0A9W6HDM9_9MICO|nr:alpha/beta hydrolase [Leifsonia poae]
MERTFIDTSLGCVAVRHGVRESGTATILLHGAAGSWTTWRAAIAAAETGGAVADLVVPDLPGWGDSPADDLSRVDAQTLAASVATVARALGYEHWRVVGHSLGGFIALELAAAEPVATESVLLVSATTLGGRGDRLSAFMRLVHYPLLVGLLQGIRLLLLLGPFAARFVRALDRSGVLPILAAPLFARTDRTAVHELARDLRPGAFVRAMQCAHDYPAEERWSRIRCPVVGLHGDRDVFVGRNDDELLTGIIPQYRAIAVPATGHFGHVEHPTLLAGALHAR